jgi:hypothetical protein
MIVMREITNAKQTQVHPCNPSQGWLRRLSSIALSSHGRIGAYQMNDPWLICRLEANALIKHGSGAETTAVLVSHGKLWIAFHHFRIELWCLTFTP